uniref:Uncharacterized protein n=1 Tax=Oryza punctata TaxID=4537 RepID=A0A0E0JM77_ORYPU
MPLLCSGGGGGNGVGFLRSVPVASVGSAATQLRGSTSAVDEVSSPRWRRPSPERRKKTMMPAILGENPWASTARGKGDSKPHPPQCRREAFLRRTWTRERGSFTSPCVGARGPARASTGLTVKILPVCLATTP